MNKTGSGKWEVKSGKRLIILLFTTTYCLLPTSCLFASGPGTTSATFLKISVGARPAGMGEAFVAVADNADTIVYNPAGLAGLEKREFSAMHLEYLQNIKYDSLSYAHPFSFGTMGVSLGYLYMNDLKRTLYYEEEIYSENGNFGACDRTLNLGFGRNFGTSDSFGINLRLIRETLDDLSAEAYSADFGFLHRQPGSPLSIGMALQNVGTTIKFIEVREKLPVIFKAGAAVRIIDEKLTIAFELCKPSDNYPELKIGSELKMFDVFAARLGYRYRTWATGNDLGPLSGLTAGLGIKIYEYNIDYAFIPYGDLGGTHRFSIGGKF